VAIVVGTRPNFIKVTRFRSAAERFPDISVSLIHTGQHYDERMAQVFFDQFGLRPDVFLDIEPRSVNEQIAEMLQKLGRQFEEDRPDLVMVVGDVNSTLAGAIAANKCGIALAHLESGLRSFDRKMPEEHNRIVADHLADLHFITEDSGLRNLRAEGIAEAGFSFVGNTMIDTLVAYTDSIRESPVVESLGIEGQPFALVTLHRPGNVDSEQGLNRILEVLDCVTDKIRVIFSAHPRTKSRLKSFGMEDKLNRISDLKVLPPLGYFDFQKLLGACTFVLTDSGGIQEETTFLQKPCLTLRPNTERPVTIETGTNTLLPFEMSRIDEAVTEILEGKYKSGSIPRLWDGEATERVLERISSYFETGI
jgi:UDP-N-acetylglucosamine 2-epimerase (non-hydrolysing)